MLEQQVYWAGNDQISLISDAMTNEFSNSDWLASYYWKECANNIKKEIHKENHKPIFISEYLIKIFSF